MNINHKNGTNEDLFREMHNSLDDKRSTIREHLIENNTSLVYYILKKYFFDGGINGQEHDDLVQSGIVGLINAVDRYDPGRGVKFSTFATPTIIGEIQNHLRDTNPLDRTSFELQLKYREAEETLSQKLGRYPTLEELVSQLDLPYEEVVSLHYAKSFQHQTSLEDPLYTSDGYYSAENLLDNIEDGRSLSMPTTLTTNFIQTIALRSAIEKLPENHRVVVELYYIKGLTQKEVGKTLQCSAVNVGELLSRACKLIKYHMRTI